MAQSTVCFVDQVRAVGANKLLVLLAMLQLQPAGLLASLIIVDELHVRLLASLQRMETFRFEPLIEFSQNLDCKHPPPLPPPHQSVVRLCLSMSHAKATSLLLFTFSTYPIQRSTCSQYSGQQLN